MNDEEWTLGEALRALSFCNFKWYVWGVVAGEVISTANLILRRRWITCIFIKWRRVFEADCAVKYAENVRHDFPIIFHRDGRAIFIFTRVPHVSPAVQLAPGPK